MAEVCMHLAGYDKDIPYTADLEDFLNQASDYEEIVKSSKWDKTLEFITLRNYSHPLLAVRANEAKKWVDTEQYAQLCKTTDL